MSWFRFIMDDVSGGGKERSKHDDTVEKMVRHMLEKICKAMGEGSHAVIPMDTGFVDAGFYGEKFFEVLKELQIGCICAASVYGGAKDLVQAGKRRHHGRRRRGEQPWDFAELERR